MISTCLWWDICLRPLRDNPPQSSWTTRLRALVRSIFMCYQRVLISVGVFIGVWKVGVSMWNRWIVVKDGSGMFSLLEWHDLLGLGTTQINFQFYQRVLNSVGVFIWVWKVGVSMWNRWIVVKNGSGMFSLLEWHDLLGLGTTDQLSEFYQSVLNSVGVFIWVWKVGVSMWSRWIVVKKGSGVFFLLENSN